MANGNGGRLRIIATPSGYQFATQVDEWLRTKYAVDQTINSLEQIAAGAPRDRSIMLPTTFFRFGDTAGKVEIHENIRGDDLFIISDVASSATPVPNDPPSQREGYKIDTSAEGIRLYRGKETLEPVYRKLDIDVNFFQVLSAVEATRNATKNGRITVVMPYFPGARQDRREGRESLDLSLYLKMLRAAGTDHVLILDPHNPAIDGFVPDGLHLDRLKSSHTLMGYLSANAGDYDLDKLYFGAPDDGALTRAKLFAQQFGAGFGAVIKDRDLLEISRLAGTIGYLGSLEDFKGRNVIVPDDMIDTAGTMIQAAKFYNDNGAKSVRLLGVHPVFSYPAIPRLQKAYDEGIVKEVIVTNSITLPDEVRSLPWLRHADVSQYYAKVIGTLHRNESISRLLETEFRREEK